MYNLERFIHRYLQKSPLSLSIILSFIIKHTQKNQHEVHLKLPRVFFPQNLMW